MIMIKRFREFAAAHRLTGFPEDHKCYNMHGHNWRVEVACLGVVDEETGCVVDFGVIDAVIDQLDHCYLNDVEGLEVPTCENIAMWLHKKIGEVVPDDVGIPFVRVWETDAGCAEYKGGER